LVSFIMARGLTLNRSLHRSLWPLVLLLAWLALPAAASERLQGLVVAIADGDTITVLDAGNTQYKVRLAGIDAPEKKQPFGNVARQHLAAAVFQKRVSVEYDKADRYGRLVGKVLVNGHDANLDQVAEGLAWHYKTYQREQTAADRRAYAAAEDEARAARRGLWREPAPLPPWEWRSLARSRNSREWGAALTPPVSAGRF
jgi:endonuclease YncB( thermonuclease family)